MFSLFICWSSFIFSFVSSFCGSGSSGFFSSSFFISCICGGVVVLLGGVDVFGGGLIVLSEGVPNKTLIIKNKFYVNESIPVVDKKIGFPKKVMSLENINLGYLFFNEVNGFDPALTVDFCALDDENCVEVTLDTELVLGCVDSETNQSLDADVFFKVHFDGEDVSEDYCELHNGVVIDGYCFVSGGVDSFYFQKESWHKLEYYCDYNGVSSDVDIEYFKVSGSSFIIHLNKKWNLISVPVQLVNNSPSSVFGSLSDVLSVWTYNSLNESWHSWSPGSPSNIDEVLPGRGYWVLMDEPSNLTFGGSLFNPVITPASKEIVYGWNLVGYYGTEGLSSYEGPLGQGKNASCVFSSIKVSDIIIPFSNLNSYWEPYNPNAWVYLNESSNLDPGAGYWLFANVDGVYAPVSNC